MFPALNGSTRAASDYLARYAANAGLDKPVSLTTTKRKIFSPKILSFFSQITVILGIRTQRQSELLRERPKSRLVTSRTDPYAEMGARLENAGLLRKSAYGNGPRGSSYKNSGSQATKAAR